MKIIKKVHNYILLEEISKEKEFITYLGLDNRNDKLLSIKEFLKKNVKQNQDFSNILRKTLEILKVLKHENITRLKDITKTKINYYIISEYCNGGKLVIY